MRKEGRALKKKQSKDNFNMMIYVQSFFPFFLFDPPGLHLIAPPQPARGSVTQSNILTSRGSYFVSLRVFSCPPNDSSLVHRESSVGGWARWGGRMALNLVSQSSVG